MIDRAWGFDAEGFESPRRPRFTGALKQNHALTNAQLIGKLKLKGPEDIAIDKYGVIFTGCCKNGKIYRIKIASNGDQHIDVFAETGGAVTLGLKFDQSGNLLACNIPKGLLSINPKGEVRVLTDHCNGDAINFPDDLDIDTDGKVYFSNASSKFNGQNGQRSMDYDLLANRPNGALYSYDPATQETRELLKGLYFANGVALSKNQDYLLVTETDRWRIKKYWLRGPNKGKTEIFADNLPGTPDGITLDSNGGYWCAFPVTRSSYLDFMCRHPKIKNLASYLPVWVWRSIPHYGLIVHLDENGVITQTLHDPTGKVFSITNIVPWNNSLFLGSLDNNAIARFDFDGDKSLELNRER